MVHILDEISFNGVVSTEDKLSCTECLVKKRRSKDILSSSLTLKGKNEILVAWWGGSGIRLGKLKMNTYLFKLTVIWRFLNFSFKEEVGRSRGLRSKREREKKKNASG